MADTELSAVTVDEPVVCPEATVRGGELHRSIVDEDTHVEGLNLSSALVGAHTPVNCG